MSEDPNKNTWYSATGELPCDGRTVEVLVEGLGGAIEYYEAFFDPIYHRWICSGNPRRADEELTDVTAWRELAIRSEDERSEVI